MVTLLEQAIAELAKLPEARQERIAEWILAELNDDTRWDTAFVNSLPQLELLGKKALDDHRAGKTQELDPDTLE
jgi:hypothetical protein